MIQLPNDNVVGTGLAVVVLAVAVIGSADEIRVS